MEGKRKRVTFGAPEERAPQMARYCEDDDDGSCGNSPPPADDDAAAPSEHDMAAAATDEAALRRVAAQAKAQRSRAYLSNISENLGLADTDKDVVVVRRAVQEHAADGDEDEDAEEGDFDDEDDDGDEDDDDDDDDDDDPDKRAIKAEIKRRESKHAKEYRQIDHVFGEEEQMERKAEYAREMGGEIEPFNLKAERNQGFFDESAGFVWRSNKDDSVKDAWLTEMDEQKLMAYRAAAAKAAAAAAAVPEAPLQSKRDLLAAVVSHLMPGETVPAALRRLKGGKSVGGETAAGGWRAKLAAAKQAKEAKAAGVTKPEEAPSAGGSPAFDSLTEASDMLMAMGLTYIYQDRQERLADRLASMASS